MKLGKSHRRPITVAEAGRRGGRVRARKYSSQQFSEWGRMGGWPKGRARGPWTEARKRSASKQRKQKGAQS